MAKTTVRQKEFGSDLGLVHEVVVKGRKVGADEDFYKALHDNEVLFRRVVQLVKGEQTPAGCVTSEEAAQIMGSNFHPVGGAEGRFGFRLNAKDKRSLLNIPFSAETLRACKDTHVLVPGLPMSIMDIHDKAPQAFYSQDNPWYGEGAQRRAFTDAKLEPGWYLVRKDEVPGSTGQRWTKQLDMVSPPDFVPEANLAVYAWVLHYLETQERMFPRVWVRTAGVTAKGGRVSLVGIAGGLYVGHWGGGAGSGIGAAEARKSN